MSNPTGSLPTREQELRLHGRLCDGDATAPSELADAYLDHLIDWLGGRHRGISHDIRVHGAEEAILALIKNPRSYDPDKKSLAVFLRMSAVGDMRNRNKQVEAENQHLESWESVEQSEDPRKYLGRDDDPSLPLRIREEVEAVESQLLPVIGEGLTEPEQAVLDLMLQGERKTELFAAACRISHLPKDEQFETVKRVKDKLKKRIERARPTHEE